MIQIIKLDPQTARLVLAFFDTHPDREDCCAKYRGGEKVTYTRKDIPKLQAVLDKDEGAEQ
jgi:hypothetical protein